MDALNAACVYLMYRGREPGEFVMSIARSANDREPAHLLQIGERFPMQKTITGKTDDFGKWIRRAIAWGELDEVLDRTFLGDVDLPPSLKI